MKHHLLSGLLSLFLLSSVLSHAQENIISNGSFEEGDANWESSVGGTAAAAFSIETEDQLQGTGAFRVDVTTIGSNAWDVQTINTYTPTLGYDYYVSFYAKSSEEGSIIRVVNQNPYWFNEVSLTTEWKKYTWTYTPSEESVQFAINFRSEATFLIDSVTIVAKPIIPPDAQADSLRAYAKSCNLNFGAAVREGSFQVEQYYRSTLLQHFNMVTAENAMKMDAIKNSATGDYNFAAGDRLVNFAIENNMKVRGHALLWHAQAPQWVRDSAWTEESLYKYLKEYVTTVVKHYKGKVAEWDVVNEAFADDNNNAQRESYFSFLGIPVFDSVFKWAHAADPDALLFYNDYETEQMGPKATKVYELVSGLKARNAPIHGVGFQTHKFHTETANLFTSMDENIKRLGALDLKVAITEVDIRMPVPASADDYEMQGHVYAELLRLALRNSDIVETFVIWGFSDKYSWVPGTFAGQGDALPFDTIYNTKPAFDSLVAVFQSNCRITSVQNSNDELDAATTFPNPFSETTSVQFPGNFDYTVYDARGKQVAQGKANNAVELGAELKAGMYSVRLHNNVAAIKTLKIVKSDQ